MDYLSGHSHFFYLCLVSDMRDRGPIMGDDKIHDMVMAYMTKHGLRYLQDPVLPLEFDRHAGACAAENGLPSNYRNPYFPVTVEG